MHASLFLIPLLALVFCSSARAVDYSQVDRTIAKEPAYQSPPKYALLLFGKEAKLRIWVVLDGQTLYLARNADGDLTGNQKRFARIEECRDVEINDPGEKISYLIRHVQTHQDKEQTREFLMADIDVKGSVCYSQYCSVELKGRAGEAKIAHFDGPLTMGPLTVNWKLPTELALVTGDKPTDLRGHVGTMDAEHGCWVVVRSHNNATKSAFPEGVYPVVDIQYPPKAPGGVPLKKRYPLDNFC
jgi:hypothetical protein